MNKDNPFSKTYVLTMLKEKQNILDNLEYDLKIAPKTDIEKEIFFIKDILSILLKDKIDELNKELSI